MRPWLFPIDNQAPAKQLKPNRDDPPAREDGEDEAGDAKDDEEDTEGALKVSFDCLFHVD